ncbi:cupin domain-containing protein [Alcaligenaceae bacterium C4P045]|nr:cupin domain-containing protein [Alcaligenaceae bacterium B3P038]MDQ2147745.1 cupin domain-containing protein [Alcaligenaceae bacterium C4P045]
MTSSIAQQDTATMPALKIRHSTQPADYAFLGARVRILLSGDHTGGQFSLLDGTLPSGSDSGMHIHRHEDESIHLVAGELEVTIGERTSYLSAGDSCFTPRGTPQRVRNLSDLPAKVVIVMTPGGHDRFVAQAGERLAPGQRLPDVVPLSRPAREQFLTVASAYGVDMVPAPEMLYG